MPDQPRKRAEILACPACGNDVGVTLGEAARVEPCPHCGGPMILPSVDGSLELPEFTVVDDAPDPATTATTRAEEEEARRQAQADRLNTLRMAALTTERRALHRRWTFTVGFAGLCAIGVAQGALLIFRNLDTPGYRTRLIALAALVAGGCYFTLHFFRRALRLSAELRQPLQLDPDATPDFEPLSDGSQHWKNLEKM